MRWCSSYRCRMTCRERAAQPTERCGPVSIPATEVLPALAASHLRTWLNSLLNQVRPCPPVQLCDGLALCPCCASRCVYLLTAIVRAYYSLLRPWDLFELLFIISAFLAGSSSRWLCTSCEELERTRGAHRLLCAPAGVESRPVQITDRDRSPPC